ncbi:helix-turn-helix domain-containing protein [Ruania alkalisoli]|uniref:Helix-turn-helix domain-containing protein n=1 Tax=Ruania alkalisoli TaxID=2779775 RepID=A0A7M1SSW3_9MICO|nr:helix-turn-helix domain-containing protein [Ruania alkalisoli]QOR69703.1 helix-turn-helix domain-containing protein [Ruania alkalisoli]
MDQRFLSLADVTEILQITMSQARALVRSGELRAIQIGGKGVWRVENSELEAYIERMYAQTADRLRSGDSGID